MQAQAVQLLLEAPHSVPASPSPPLSRAQACGLACWLRVAWAQAEAGRAIGGARLSICLCFSRLPLCLSVAFCRCAGDREGGEVRAGVRSPSNGLSSLPGPGWGPGQGAAVVSAGRCLGTAPHPAVLGVLAHWALSP